MLAVAATMLLGQTQRAPAYNVNLFHDQLAACKSEDDRAALAVKVKAWLGKDFADKGVAFKQDQLHGVWFGRAKSTPFFASADGTWKVTPKPLAEDIYFYEGWRPEGDGFNWLMEADGKTTPAGLIEFYKRNPEMEAHEGVPKGKLIPMGEFASKVFEGTKRNWWIYIPAGLKPGEKPGVMVWQDGNGAKNYVPTCFDNLIAKGDIPPLVGVFIDPGHFDGNRSNRSVEYDTLSDKYSHMIIDEILPAVEKVQPLNPDPLKHAIGGGSSGAICAFTVGWHRSDTFTKVLSYIGSYTNLQPGKTGIEGGHNYPAMIRKFDKRPIRVFLQDGANDLNNPFGNWPLANQYMANSLAFRDWDYKFVFGKGGHNDRHIRSIMPDALRWLFRDWKATK